MTILPWCLRRSSSTSATARVDLLGGRHQRGAVLQRPAVVLHVGDLDAAGFQLQRKIDHLGDALDVGAMHHQIDGERQAEPHRFRRQRVLALERAAIARDAVGRHGVGVLDRDLDVIEAGLPQIAHGARGDADAGGDQIGVEPGLARVRRDVDEIAPRAGLAAGQMHVQHAERRRLLEHPRPGRRRRARRRAIPARADWSNRDSRAGSGASARRAGPEVSAGFGSPR